MFEKDNIVLSLKVLEAYTRDVGRAVARVDSDSMKSLKVSNSDIVEIGGKKKTVAMCLPIYPDDEGKGITRIDNLVRNNAGIEIGDTIAIKKIKAADAEKIVVTPLEEIPPIDERYLTDALESVPMIKGDNVEVPYFGGTLHFQVIGVVPASDAVLVTKKTVFHIAERVKTEIEEQMEPLTDKIYSLIEKHYEELTSLLGEQTLNEEKIIESYDKIKRLSEIIAYLSKKK